MLLVSYCDNGSLLSQLRARYHRGDSFRVAAKLQYSLQICKGMAYLSRSHIVHRDLATRNVLVDVEWKAMIADFGLSRETKAVGDGDDSGDYYRSSGSVFPIRWTSPESMQTLKFTEKSDVWSFGIVIVEIFQDGEIPYKQLPSNSVIFFLEKGERIPIDDVGCSDDVYDVLMSCWAASPEDRPTFDELIGVLHTVILDHAPVGSEIYAEPGTVLTKRYATVHGSPNKTKSPTRGDAPKKGLVRSQSLPRKANIDMVALGGKQKRNNEYHGHGYHGFGSMQSSTTSENSGRHSGNSDMMSLSIDGNSIRPASVRRSNPLFQTSGGYMQPLQQGQHSQHSQHVSTQPAHGQHLHHSSDNMHASSSGYMQPVQHQQPMLSGTNGGYAHLRKGPVGQVQPMVINRSFRDLLGSGHETITDNVGNELNVYNRLQRERQTSSEKQVTAFPAFEVVDAMQLCNMYGEMLPWSDIIIHIECEKRQQGHTGTAAVQTGHCENPKHVQPGQ